jgi:hypothetical protein
MKFQKISDPKINPVLGPIEDSTFKCPVRRKEVNWEAKDVFNPAAVVKDDKVYLLYRAEDRVREIVEIVEIFLIQSLSWVYSFFSACVCFTIYRPSLVLLSFSSHTPPPSPSSVLPPTAWCLLRNLSHRPGVERRRVHLQAPAD